MAYAEGYADGIANTGEIVYTYHIHGDGYCDLVPVYHVHWGSNGKNQSGIQKAINNATGCYSGATTSDIKSSWRHTNGCGCGATSSCAYGNSVTDYYVKDYQCGKTTSSIDSYSCRLTEDTILSATIVFN